MHIYRVFVSIYGKFGIGGRSWLGSRMTGGLASRQLSTSKSTGGKKGRTLPVTHWLLHNLVPLFPLPCFPPLEPPFRGVPIHRSASLRTLRLSSLSKVSPRGENHPPARASYPARPRLAPTAGRRARTPHGEGKPSRLPRAVARPTVPGRPSRMSFISPRRARGDGRCPLGARRGMEKYNSYSSVSITALEQPRLKPPVPLRTFLANTI